MVEAKTVKIVPQKMKKRSFVETSAIASGFFNCCTLSPVIIVGYMYVEQIAD